MDRRTFLGAAASASSLLTAGCAGTDDGTTPPPESGSTSATAERDAETTAAATDGTGGTPTTERESGDDEPATVGDRTPVGEPPAARIEATPTRGPAPLTVAFDGSGSVDPDGEIVEYIWLFKDMRPPATGPTVEHTFTSDGTTRPVELIVTDDDGNTDRATVDIRIEPAE